MKVSAVSVHNHYLPAYMVQLVNGSIFRLFVRNWFSRWHCMTVFTANLLYLMNNKIKWTRVRLD